MATQKRKRLPTFALITLIVLIVYMVSLILPMIWLCYSSFKGVVDFQIDSVFPSLSLNFESYAMAFENFFMPTVVSLRA